MTKTIEAHFADWESEVFGIGYGTGEEHTLGALKSFLAAIGRDDAPHAYDYQKLEQAVTAPVAWLLINTLVHADIIEYGTSPRYGWLTKEGEALKAFVDSKTVQEMELIVSADDHDRCTATFCNCGPKGYSATKICKSPFWETKS